MIEKLIIWALPILLTALLTSIITRKYKDRERFLSACDIFNQAFIPAIHELKQNVKSAARIILFEYSKHEFAMTTFLHNIAPVQIDKRFNKKWEEYRQYYDNYNNAFGDSLARPDAKSIIDFVCKTRTNDDKTNREQIINLLEDILKIIEKHK